MIYIIAHKEFDNIAAGKKGYSVLQVGNGKSFGDFRDNEGENISDKNKNYCELTGLYWMWKNTSNEITGLVHYRRFFNNSFLFDNVLSEADAAKILMRYDIILPFQVTNSETVKQDYCRECGYLKDLELTREVINELSPDYVEDFDRLMNGNKVFYFNMFVCKRELLSRYCEWLFNILFTVETKADLTGYDPYHQRIYGFLSERLLSLFVLHNNLKVYQMGVIMLDHPWSAKKKLLTGLKREYYKLKQ
ncbi:MAG: DUF4422 domain-containing protein [Lachnospira sp.]|nr:DUF4422 domain-containing protein [Lachnospira sp.]